ncbi:MAG TPA: hypothetical protein PLA74_00030 [Syntrophales bacterium]|nr:hypothetical protein [Syntrophales bacterium]HPQ43110.1 hypothetical protein [Syntrophales bacterium]
MNLVEETVLSNNLTMQVWDRSRAIASDTTKVELRITIPIRVMQEYFTDLAHFQQVVAVFGPVVVYEYTKERTFVSTPDSGKVFHELLEDFQRDSLPYLSRTEFPARFSLSKLRDIRQHPYRYHDVLEKQTSEE